MKALRTPHSRFENLPGYAFEPHYADIDGLQVHYVDEGPADGELILLLHGEPSWSYLYRKMIPPLVAAGFRVIAPDLIGFGKSDKPVNQSDYTYAIHVAWMRQFIETLELTNITLFCQDWGSLIGLRVAAENEQRFSRIVLSNGFLPTGDQPMPRVFKIWKAFARFSPWFPIGRIVQSGTASELSKSEMAAYDAPFPNSKYKAGARAFPTIVPVTPDDPASEANRAAWDVFRQWTKPFLTAFGNRDPITRGGHKMFQEQVPGCKHHEHVKIRDAAHFLQEDKGAEIAALIVKFVRSS